MRKATGQTRIDSQEVLHLVLIASGDDHKLAAIVLHALHQRIDGLLAVHVVVGRQRIGLIDEEDATHGLVAHAVDNLGSLAHILTHQGSPAGLDDTAGGQDIHRLQHLAHLAGDTGLSCTRITRQDEVHRQLLDAACTHSGTLLDKHALYGQTTYHILHRAHANELVEFVEHLIDRTRLGSSLHSEVGSGNAVHILVLEVGIAHHGNQALALSLDSLVEDATRLASIAEVLVATQVELFELAMKGTFSLCVEGKVLSLSQVEEYLRQFVGGIVFKMDGLREAALQSRVGIDEFVHVIRITGHDADELATVVLQALQQCVDSLSAKGVLVTGLQRIGFVDEEHTTHGGVDELVGLDSRLPRKASHQFRAVSLYQLAS